MYNVTIPAKFFGPNIVSGSPEFIALKGLLEATAMMRFGQVITVTEAKGMLEIFTDNQAHAEHLKSTTIAFLQGGHPLQGQINTSTAALEQAITITQIP